MSAKESSRSVVTIAQTTSSNDAIIASSKSISMSPSESRSDGTLTKKQKCSIVKQIIMYVIMPLKRVATIENFSYVVVKNRALNCSDSNAMFWPKWAQKYIDQQKLMTLFNNIYINMNVSERSIAICGQNRSNNVIKRRHHCVVENVYRCIPNTVVPCDIYDFTK